MERLAELASLSVGFLSEIERGRKSPGLDTLQSLARALGVQLTDLVAPLVIDAPRVVHKFQLLGRLESVMREVYTEDEAARIVAEVQSSDPR